MKMSSDSDPDLLRREADECLQLLAQATFSGIIALLMERADTCQIMADRIVAGQRLRWEPDHDEPREAPGLNGAAPAGVTKP
jgi:hypothetical protein